MKQRLLLLALSVSACGPTGQSADASFDTHVATPAYRDTHPEVLFDEAHRNVHTTHTGYGPFAHLLESDGYTITRNRDPFSAPARSASVLVIVNASPVDESTDNSAFTDSEIVAVREWVRSGGSLLLVTDHFPYSGAARRLATALGATLSRGMVMDSVHFDSTSAFKDESQLVFSEANGLLGSHAILRGIHRVVSFTGAWVDGPSDATALLRLSPQAYYLEPSVSVEQRGSDRLTHVNYENPTSAGGHALAIAFQFGRGRVVMIAEAGMLTAQKNRDGSKFGMNLPGNDNRQFVLNIIHWLSHAIP